MPATATIADCTRCDGTGQYHGTRRDGSSYVGRCFACQGAPRWARSRPAYNRPASAVAVAATNATLAGQNNWLRFAGQYPAESAWLWEQGLAGVEFANSLMQGCRRYGGLTPRQLAAVQRNLGLRETSVAPVAPSIGDVIRANPETPDSSCDIVTTPAPVAAVRAGLYDMSRILAAFDAAAASGLRKVRLTLGAVDFKRGGSRFLGGRGEGFVLAYYKLASRTGTSTYCGYFNRGGEFFAAREFQGRENQILAAVQAFESAAADPQAAARTHGADTGFCSCCRRELTDPPSVMAGIGPVCIRRFGWSF